MNGLTLRHLRSGLVAALALCAALQGARAAPAAVPLIAPASPVWDAGKGFDFDLGKKKTIKTRQSVSGIACNLDARQRRVCLLAFDEGAQARYAVLKTDHLKPDASPVEFAGVAGELDAEAAATDGRYLYVTGSHSAKRSDCASNPGSRHVIRLPLDPATGQALPTGHGDTTRLWSLMQAQPALQAHVGERICLGRAPYGINIEGLAVQGGQLHFGFRGPVTDGVAPVLTVRADALFQGGDPQPRVSQLALGEHRGIRDMVAVSDGILLLAGPDDEDAGANVGWALYHWNGQPTPHRITPRPLAALDLRRVQLRSCDKTLKPEAITVLKETPQTYTVLILSDGMCDGGAMVFEVAR